MELRKHYQMMLRCVPTVQDQEEAQGGAGDFTEGMLGLRGE